MNGSGAICIDHVDVRFPERPRNVYFVSVAAGSSDHGMVTGGAIAELAGSAADAIVGGAGSAGSGGER